MKQTYKTLPIQKDEDTDNKIYTHDEAGALNNVGT